MSLAMTADEQRLYFQCRSVPSKENLADVALLFGSLPTHTGLTTRTTDFFFNFYIKTAGDITDIPTYRLPCFAVE